MLFHGTPQQHARTVNTTYTHPTPPNLTPTHKYTPPHTHSVPLSSLCNQPPGAGTYAATLQVAPVSDMDARVLASAACHDEPADGTGEPAHMAQQVVEMRVEEDGTVLLPLEVGALRDLACTGAGDAQGVQLELTFSKS